MAGLPWSAYEPDYFSLRRESVRLFARARRRGLLVLGLALATAAAATVKAYRRPQMFRAKAAIRISEVVDPKLPRTQWSERELQSYVNEVALSNSVLLEVWKQHIWDKQTPFNASRVLESMRDTMSVKVVKNVSVALAAGGQEPRSAHVLLEYPAITAERARNVIQGLIRPIIDTNSRRRREEADRARRSAEIGHAAAQARYDELHKRALEVVKDIRTGGTMKQSSPLHLMGLDQALEAARRRVSRLDEDRRNAERMVLAATHKRGIDMEVASESLTLPTPRAFLLPWVAALAFLLALPISAVVVAAFDNRVHLTDDVRRLGLPLLGRLSGVGPTGPAQPRGTGQQTAPERAG